MALTSIGDQLTPGRPIEITFAPELGLPSANQEVLLIGHKDAASGSEAPYTVVTISNVADVNAASGEAADKFGEGSELQKMIVAAVRANQGGSTFPALKAVALAAADVDFGASDAALTAAAGTKQEFVVSPYDADDTTLTGKIETHAETLSGAQRVENNQYGTIGVAANKDETDHSALFKYDSQFIQTIHFLNSSTALSVGEIAAACAAKEAANISPFNPLDDVTINGLDAPTDESEYLQVGAGLESEVVLDQGWTPLKVKPNGEVAFVRTVTGRRTIDGSGVVDVTAYYDVQDFQVLYFWRKTLFSRFSQADLKRAKASADTAQLLLSEVIRLAKLFEVQNMFQAVDELAKQFQVQRASSDRHRFDVRTPVNVIPGLHVIATNVEASTQFDELSI